MAFSSLPRAAYGAGRRRSPPRPRSRSGASAWPGGARYTPGVAGTGSTQRAVAAGPPRSLARLRGASMGALVMLIIQFALGVGVNLYITPAEGGVSEAFSNGPLLALHAVLGLLLIIAAIDLLVRAILARHRVVIVASAVGLLAIIAAAGSGIAFLRDGQNGSSMGMAIAACVAILCYAVCLRVLCLPEPAQGR